ncbi:MULTISPECIES: type I-E CRISPR-associated protein Cas5/CasD [unclassified Oceanobacter]|uniref:type I-E CRISPR-associated protein Cas5/CasD n=1 Tax=unclassified Oceanobacter TaxID=2620260 RepID=UPI002735533B|nr:MULTISPECIES: type I-E CRISPR-associated protein Cas5/CasD [unclassified Oceanobacter]MDP2505857.1 type I-E CRISPR-associated protein Cas5/CasD [Oceanobacter sp. 3_MG-2023]MDP2610548.1 type I-E CRISPR-associated protein Cas5/CasD [Oceanobacter sp. 1_MG-2023]MDP2613805.1 type I-E CRISPR-associated protein Cas5/CasD [Oceanobacter sp. 2_MG-2023]
MSEQTHYLLLWLEGPLQAWGHDSKFGVRDTLNFPTRSGVLGLLCCARGAGGPEVEWLQQMSTMAMEVRAYARTDRNGSPVMQELPLRDFQMVGSGYDNSDPWQSLLIPKTAEGKKAVGGGTKMTYRYYLQDSAFAVVLEVPEKQAQALAEALQNPVWDLYLGRKTCAPTELIYQGLYENTAAAWQQADTIAESKQRQASYAVMDAGADSKSDKESEANGGEILTLNDVPIQFGTNKRYRDRQVTLLELT